jgi:uncharacterized delta-60 repeat protein
MIVTPEGKIYAVGETESFWNGSYNNQTIVRLNNDGSFDPSFGYKGERYFDLSTQSSFKAIKMQNDGKLVVAGNKSVALTIARITENATLDTTFSSDGRDTPLIGSSAGFSKSISIQPDGKIIISGNVYYGALGYYQPVVVRYLSNGKLDTTFSNGGISKILVSTVFHDGCFSILQPNGKLIVGGDINTNSTTKTDLFLFRLTTGTILSSESFIHSKFISYPNPAENFITVMSNQNENFAYQIFDVSGKLIKTGKNTTNEKIDIQNLQKGNYILQLENENSQKQTVKLIKN